MSKHYVFYSRDGIPKNGAHLVQATNFANAAANLGYSAVLAYPSLYISYNPLKWLFPFKLQTPTKDVIDLYNLQDQLKVAPLPVLPFEKLVRNKFTSISTYVCKYCLPVHMRASTQLVHSRDWNFVKAAIQNGIAATYEHHHHENKQFEPEIVNNPLLQVVVTVSDPVRDSLIASGMPAGKIVKLHSGFNKLFGIRQLQEAEHWRDRFLTHPYQYLAVYSGGLHRFKGVNLLLDVATLMPDIHFVFAGGETSRVRDYEELARQKQLKNVTFLGHLPHRQLPSLLQAADVLLHPHGDNKEATYTSPLKFFEYVASGSPIAATRIPPLREFEGSGVVAGWCEADNPVKYSECVRHVLATYPRKPEGYANAIAFIQQFSWESRITKLLSYVEESRHPERTIRSSIGTTPLRAISS